MVQPRAVLSVRFPAKPSEPGGELTQKGVLCQLDEGKLLSPCLWLGQECLLTEALLQDATHLGVDPLQPGCEMAS